MDFLSWITLRQCFFVNTVKKNKEHYTRCAYAQFVKARKLQNIMGYPSTATFTQDSV